MTISGQDWAEDEDSFNGSLAKVIRLATGDEAIYAMFQNGNIFRLETGPTSLVAGDVILVGENRWKGVEAGLWREPRAVGVVRKAGPDRLLVETSSGLHLTETRGSIDVVAGNTIVFSSKEGAVEVLDPEPIRVRLRDDDDVDDLSRFEFTPTAGSISYADFGGYPHVVARARHLIETQFKHERELRAIGARPVRGVLLSGPPGTGKTHLARVIAAEAGASFFVVGGPAIVSKYVGDTEQLLRRIFEEARLRSRAIVFFDEIDSIAGERKEGSHEASDRLVAQLLTEMDGFANAGGNVVVLAATNRADTIDPALLRPGRFDWEIRFDLPAAEDRLAILEVDARRLVTVSRLPLEELAHASDGWSGADLGSLWTEAALMAASQGRQAIDGEDLLNAFSIVDANKRDRADHVQTP